MPETTIGGRIHHLHLPPSPKFCSRKSQLVGCGRGRDDRQALVSRSKSTRPVVLSCGHHSPLGRCECCLSCRVGTTESSVATSVTFMLGKEVAIHLICRSQVRQIRCAFLTTRTFRNGRSDQSVAPSSVVIDPFGEGATRYLLWWKVRPHGYGRGKNGRRAVP